MRPSAYCIIVAAGSGRRFGTPLPKQFCELNGKAVLMHTIERMRRALPGSKILLVINSDYQSTWLDMCETAGFKSPQIIFGGETRWQSVKNAVSNIPGNWDGPVLIHDGARPLISGSVVSNLMEVIASGAEGAIPCIPVTDSLREVIDNHCSKAVDRSHFRAVQTPQAFNGQIIIKAYSNDYSPLMTDDASVCEMAGYTDLRIVEGDPMTLKITNPADIATVAYLLKSTTDGPSASH